MELFIETIYFTFYSTACVNRTKLQPKRVFQMNETDQQCVCLTLQLRILFKRLGVFSRICRNSWVNSTNTRHDYCQQTTQIPLRSLLGTFIRSRWLTIKQLEGDRVVHVLPPVFSISGNGNLPVGPLTSQVNANTGDHCGLVLEAKGSEV